MYMNRHFGSELHRVLCGVKIGEGASRKVYECLLNDKYVVKVEQGSKSFQNVSEWETWGWVLGKPKHECWFAQCHNISPSGMVLIQRRALPVRDKELPKLLPSFLCDLKPENFGLVDGKFVCFDYGTVASVVGEMRVVMTKAEWRK